ncbi:hypothetical protein K458DRAFT_413482 [Lentithecium fluviatile CBS 122367]|uniref:Uncharacterized protein n=1 Tax=Lentithecium fluviatile CBS 122367 TaxID=1168545 RepID=A0A6G1JGD3_9PLEO|nr:hypothetical protein K458DRAFT_413482 [Lentithecium fluviatile CBS 122367]
MGIYDRQPPTPDLTSIELRSAFRSPSPAPTYRSTNRETFWPTPKNGNNPYSTFTNTNSSSSSTSFIWHDEKAALEAPYIHPKPEPHDPNHPHYATPSRPLPAPLPHPPSSHPKRSSRRRILPWLLATLFFLSTLYFISLLLGSKFLSIIRPINTQTHTINLVINGNMAAPGQTPTLLVSTVITPVPTGEGQDNTGKPENDLQSSQGLSGTPATPTPTPTTLVTSTVSKKN